MSSPPAGPAPASPTPPQPAANEEETGVPGLRSWRAVYLFVFGCFLVWVALLAVLTRWFS